MCELYKIRKSADVLQKVEFDPARMRGFSVKRGRIKGLGWTVDVIGGCLAVAIQRVVKVDAVVPQHITEHNHLLD